MQSIRTVSSSALFQKPTLNEGLANVRQFLDIYTGKTTRYLYRIQVMLRASHLRNLYAKLVNGYFQGKEFPVIHLNFTNVRGDTFEVVRASLMRYLAGAYQECYPLVQQYLESERGVYDKSEFLEAMQGKPYMGSLYNLQLQNLIEVLNRATGSKVVVIVEEIDLPVHGVREEDLTKTDDFFGSFFSASVDHERFVESSFLTGRLPVHLPASTIIDSVLDDRFKGCFPENENTPVLMSSPHESAIRFYLKKYANHDALRNDLQQLLAGGIVKASPGCLHCRFNFGRYHRYRQGDLWRTLMHLGLLELRNGLVEKDGALYEPEDYELGIASDEARKYIEMNLNNWLEVTALAEQSTTGLRK